MSDTFDAAAHAAATEGASAPLENSAPQADNTAEIQAETPAPSASAEETNDASPEDAHETKSRAEQRIKQLAARDKEAREEIAFLREQLTRLQQQPQQPAAEQGPPPLPADLTRWLGDEPKPDAFPAGEFDPQYLRAIAKYEARAEQAQMVAAQRAAQARMAEQQRLESIRQSVAEAEKAMPDIREVASALGQRLPNWQANLVAEAGPEVIYAIGKDAEAEARIRAANSPLAVAREIGRIEARLERAKDTPPPQPTSAPDPAPRAVRGGNVGTRAPGEMSMAQYAEWRGKQAWNG
jgi:hypothetical protein